MDRQRLVEFARGGAAVLVVEEKRPVMEDQVARHLYGLNATERPALAGKQDLRGAPLSARQAGELTVAQIRQAIKTVLDQIGVTDARLEKRFQAFRRQESRALRRPRPPPPPRKARPAYFCLGLPPQYQHADPRRLTRT